MSADDYFDSELGRFRRAYIDEPFSPRRHPSPYFEAKVISEWHGKLLVGLEGPASADAVLLLPRLSEILSTRVPVRQGWGALLESFPEVFTWQSIDDMTSTLAFDSICVGREGDYAINYAVLAGDVDLYDYWPAVWVNADGSIRSAHSDGGRGAYPGGRDYASSDDMIEFWMMQDRRV